MGSLLQAMTLEYSTLNRFKESIVTEKDIMYTIHPLRNKWIFPWKYSKVQLNISKMYLPDYHFGFITAYNPKNFDIPVQVVIPTEGNFTHYILVKPRGILPKRINIEDPIVTMMIVSGAQCTTLEL